MALGMVVGLVLSGAWAQRDIPPALSVPDTLMNDTAAADTAAAGFRLVKRDFVHKEQLLIGTWMMVFVVFIIVTCKNYNPG